MVKEENNKRNNRGVLYRFLFLFWGALADWDRQLHHYQGFGVGRGGGGNRRGGFLHLTFSETTGLSGARDKGRGRSVGWGKVRRGETGYDGGPGAVATAAAAARGSLPVISVLSALANLTNYTPLPPPP